MASANLGSQKVPLSSYSLTHGECTSRHRHAASLLVGAEHSHQSRALSTTLGKPSGSAHEGWTNSKDACFFHLFSFFFPSSKREESDQFGFLPPCNCSSIPHVVSWFKLVGVFNPSTANPFSPPNATLKQWNRMPPYNHTKGYPELPSAL